MAAWGRPAHSCQAQRPPTPTLPNDAALAPCHAHIPSPFPPPTRFLPAPAAGLKSAVRSAWAGLAAGCLHTLAGADHLAALTPLTIGRSHLRASLLGALWGFGHSTGQLILGLLMVLLKDRFQQASGIAARGGRRRVQGTAQEGGAGVRACPSAAAAQHQTQARLFALPSSFLPFSSWIAYAYDHRPVRALPSPPRSSCPRCPSGAAPPWAPPCWPSAPWACTRPSLSSTTTRRGTLSAIPLLRRSPVRRSPRATLIGAFAAR